MFVKGNKDILSIYFDILICMGLCSKSTRIKMFAFIYFVYRNNYFLLQQAVQKI